MTPWSSFHFMQSPFWTIQIMEWSGCFADNCGQRIRFSLKWRNSTQRTEGHDWSGVRELDSTRLIVADRCVSTALVYSFTPYQWTDIPTMSSHSSPNLCPYSHPPTMCASKNGMQTQWCCHIPNYLCGWGTVGTRTRTHNLETMRGVVTGTMWIYNTIVLLSELLFRAM